MKVWEEEWKVEAVQNGVEGRMLLVGGEAVALFSGPDDGASQARAQLAAQAPAMTRLLLDGLQVHRAYCSNSESDDEGNWTCRCSYGNTLRAAGVLP